MREHKRMVVQITILLIFILTIPGFLVGEIHAAPAENRPTFTQRRAAVLRALGWLHDKQGGDGRFGLSGTVMDAAATADAVLVIALAGQDPGGLQWSKGGQSALTVLADLAPGYVKSDAGRAGKVVEAIVAAGADPRDFGGTDYIAIIQATYDADTGLHHPSFLFRHALAVQALAVSGADAPRPAVTAILDTQGLDGGWNWYVPVTRTLQSEVDSTARILQSIVRAGVPVSSTAVISATQFLATQQRSDGGWARSEEEDYTNANSTALAIQALVAAGIHPSAPEWAREGGDPVIALLRFQEPSGAFAYTIETPESRMLATLDALAALAPSYPNEPQFLRRPTVVKLWNHIIRRFKPCIFFACIAK